jgi:hypothetical protein
VRKKKSKKPTGKQLKQHYGIGISKRVKKRTTKKSTRRPGTCTVVSRAIARRNPSSVKIGELLGIMYSRDGVKYLHKFTKDRPSLHTDMTGTMMFIEGGKYHWTPFGVK